MEGCNERIKHNTAYDGMHASSPYATDLELIAPKEHRGSVFERWQRRCHLENTAIRTGSYRHGRNARQPASRYSKATAQPQPDINTPRGGHHMGIKKQDTAGLSSEGARKD